MSMASQASRAPSLLKLNAVDKAAASASLHCFPFAGGSAHFYKDWGQLELGHIQGYAIELPGRGLRAREALIPGFSGLIQDLVRNIAPVLEPPYAFFGHSMGALLAFEFTRSLESLGAPLPSHLFLSACRAPHLPGRNKPWHALPEDELISEVEQLEGAPPGALQNKDIRAMMMPVLRADFRLAEQYSHAATGPINVPVSVFGGTSDPLVNPDELAAWSMHTNDLRRVRLFPGGHFYLNYHAGDVVDAIRRDLVPGIESQKTA